MPNRRFLPALLVLILLVVLGTLSIYFQNPPRALPPNAAAKVFSAGRALPHLKIISRQPHSIGTAAHGQVREYLLTTLQQLAIPAQVQATTVSNRASRRTAMAYVQNVIGVIKGTRPGKAVLLIAHYDSQPNTYGAGDNGAGVATLLEVSRALRAGPPLQNDVILLFTDGEEFGLFGARAFLQHPLARQVGLVLNIEGRGNQGPSLTFEISPENGWVVEQFSRAVPYPLANSLMYEVYRHLPNDTDFTVFRQAGYSGFNTAFIGGYVHYHKLTDHPDNLDLNSLQHHGSNALALARHFGNISLSHTKAPDKVFFNPVGTWLVHYPMRYNLFWLIFTALPVMLVLAMGLRQKVFTLWQLSQGFIFFIFILIAVAALLIIVNQVVIRFLPFHRFINGVYQANLFWLAYALIAFGLFWLLSHLVLRFISWHGLTAGILVFFMLLVLAGYAKVPAAVFILLFPLMFVGWAVVGLLLFGKFKNPGWSFYVVLLLGYLPAVFLLVPLAHTTFAAFNLQLPLAPVLVLLLLWGLGWPLLYQLIAQFRWGPFPVLPGLFLPAGLFLAGAAVYLEQPSPGQPLHSDVSYYLNLDRQKAYWASGYTKPDAWNQQFFTLPEPGILSEFFSVPVRMGLVARARTLPLAAPVAQIKTDTLYRGQRKLILKLYSPRQASQLQIDIVNQSEEALTAATLNGEAIPNLKQNIQAGVLLSTLLLGLPANQGVTLTLTMPQTEGVWVSLYDRSVGLPPALLPAKRPAWVIPEQGINSNITVVKKSYRF